MKQQYGQSYFSIYYICGAKEHVSTDSSFGNFNGVMPTKSFADTYNIRRRNFVKDIYSTLCYRTIRYFSIKIIKRIDVYVPKLRLFAKWSRDFNSVTVSFITTALSIIQRINICVDIGITIRIEIRMNILDVTNIYIPNLLSILTIGYSGIWALEYICFQILDLSVIQILRYLATWVS